MTRSATLARVIRWALFGAYLLLTILLSSMSRPPIGEAVSDTLLHALEFSAMAALLLQALGQGLFKRHEGRHLLAAAVFGIAYGATDEIHQYFVPNRHSSVKDWIVDTAATLATVGLFTLLRFWMRRDGPGPLGPPRVELLTRPECHLCVDARAVLTSVLGAEGKGFTVVDVDASLSLAALYGDEVPVVLVDGIKRFKGRVDARRLERLLAERARLRHDRRVAGARDADAAIES